MIGEKRLLGTDAFGYGHGGNAGGGKTAQLLATAKAQGKAEAFREAANEFRLRLLKSSMAPTLNFVEWLDAQAAAAEEGK